jgi:hypothetical protein
MSCARSSVRWLPRRSRPLRSPGPVTAGAGADGTRIERGALTERHVRAAGPKTTITIGRAVVITPLARERAKAMDVEIIRIQE